MDGAGFPSGSGEAGWAALPGLTASQGWGPLGLGSPAPFPGAANGWWEQSQAEVQALCPGQAEPHGSPLPPPHMGCVWLKWREQLVGKVV